MQRKRNNKARFSINSNVSNKNLDCNANANLQQKEVSNKVDCHANARNDRESVDCNDNNENKANCNNARNDKESCKQKQSMQTNASHKDTQKQTSKEANTNLQSEIDLLKSKLDTLKNQDFNTLYNEIQSIKIALDTKATNEIEKENETLKQEIQALKKEFQGMQTNTNQEYIKAHDKALKQQGEEQTYLLNRINAVEKKINTHIESQIAINAEIKSNLKVYENNDIFKDIKDLKQQIDTLTNHFLEIENKYNEKLENIKQLIPFYKNKSVWDLIKMKFQTQNKE